MFLLDHLSDLKVRDLEKMEDELFCTGAVRLEKCGVASPNQKHIFVYDAETQNFVHEKGGK